MRINNPVLRNMTKYCRNGVWSEAEGPCASGQPEPVCRRVPTCEQDDRIDADMRGRRPRPGLVSRRLGRPTHGTSALSQQLGSRRRRILRPRSLRYTRLARSLHPSRRLHRLDPIQTAPIGKSRFWLRYLKI